MKALPVVVLVTAVALAILRRRRRRGRTRLGQPARSTREHSVLFGDTGLVAAREIRERLRGRFLRVVTLVLLVIVGAAIVVPTFARSSTPHMRIGVVAPLTADLRVAAVRAGRHVGMTVQLVDEPNVARARSQLRDRHVVAVIDGNRTVIVETPLDSSATTATTQLVRAVASSIGIADALHAARLSPAQAATVSEARPLPIESVSRNTGRTTARATSIIGVVLIFIMLSQYLTWTLMGVTEEKSSRVVEVLLATVRPVQLLAGKVLGIGAVAMAQACLVVAFALVLAEAVGSSVLHGTSPAVMAASLAWLVLGYAFYSWVYAAAGSMVERQDQVQSLALPLSVPLIVGYVVALISASAAHPSLLLEVLAFLPPTAPFAMPTLVATGTATWWWFTLSACISVLCTIGMAHLAGGVYRRAVLRTGRVVSIKELISLLR